MRLTAYSENELHRSFHQKSRGPQRAFNTFRELAPKMQPAHAMMKVATNDGLETTARIQPDYPRSVTAAVPHLTLDRFWTIFLQTSLLSSS
jgi:hypothetical protein